VRRRAAAPSPIIVLAKDQGSLYEFLKERQESAGKGRVVLDRRVAERRRASAPVPVDRRGGDRRAPIPDAARALMSVLGFAVLHPAGDGSRGARGAAGAPRSRKAGPHPPPQRRSATRPSPPRRRTKRRR
jgi:hypothetical protein